MVGYDENKKNKSSDFVIAGAVSGMITRFLCQPLDVLKIRFQLQVEPIQKESSTSKYKGLRQAFLLLVKEENVASLWKGHLPAQYLSIAYGIVQFGTFEKLTKSAPAEWRSKYPISINTISGSISGCAATIVCQPFDVLRTRLVAQGEPKVYQGFLDAAKNMQCIEGSRSFFKGLSPTLIQIVPLAGLQFGFYNIFTKLWDNALLGVDQASIGLLKGSVCGASAGVLSKSIVYPLDLAKKRIQVQGFGNARLKFGEFHHTTGLIHCIRETLRSESLRGLYKGYYPTVLKAALTTGLHFSIYEKTCHYLSRN